MGKEEGIHPLSLMQMDKIPFASCFKKRNPNVAAICSLGCQPIPLKAGRVTPEECLQLLCLGPRGAASPPLVVAQGLGKNQSRAGEQPDLEEYDHLEKEALKSLSQKSSVLRKGFTNTILLAYCQSCSPGLICSTSVRR